MLINTEQTKTNIVKKYYKTTDTLEHLSENEVLTSCQDSRLHHVNAKITQKQFSDVFLHNFIRFRPQVKELSVLNKRDVTFANYKTRTHEDFM